MMPPLASITTQRNPTSSAISATAAIAFLLLVAIRRRHFDGDDDDEEEKKNRNVTKRLWDSVAGIRLPGRKFVFGFSLLSIPRNELGALSASSSPTDRIEGNFNDSVRGIKNNRKKIQAVLNYWFGQYSPEKSQKMLWMIATSSEKHREKIDSEIAERFEGLLRDLSLSPVDRTGETSTSLWKHWCLDPDGIYGVNGKIAAIIVLDQFSRHILRHFETNAKIKNDLLRQPLQAKEALDRLALAASKLLIQDHQRELDCGMIPLPMRVFALMPFRHESTIESVKYVQHTIEEMASLEEENLAMVGRFRKATNRRLAVLQDEQRRTGTASNFEGKVDGNSSDPSSENQARKEFSDDNILETFPFETDMTPALRHPIHKTIVEFLAEQGIHPVEAGRGKSQKGNTKSTTNKAGVIVSLSGGVDSMVIASVLAHLKNSCGYDHMTIIAVHIDYANRPESGAEADYVRRYCEDQLEGKIDFSCRRINEVTRGITDRDDYERIAREIRYTSYREAVERAKDAMGLFSKEERDGTVVGVLLGHHRGDLRENVLSNAHKGCGPLDLSGMTAVSKNNGITLYRPLLPVEKSFVFDYAHNFGVPYFKDTTPHWSTRGKLRNKLLPLLEEIYGDGSMNNLSNLAVESDNCRALMNKSMIEPFLESIVRKPMGIMFNTVSWKDQPLFFWKVVLREALHSIGLGMFSDKSVTAFLERIKAKKLKTAWLQCRKDYGVYLREDGNVFVLFPSSFPWSKKDAYRLSGEVLDFDTKKMVGPWVVRTEIFPESDAKDFPETLDKKAVPSMEDFLDGKVEYFLSAPTFLDKSSKSFIPKPLVFRTFSKTNRPGAWKKCDLRIQSTLPVLGIDDSNGGGSDNAPQRLIRVSMVLSNPSKDE